MIYLNNKQLFDRYYQDDLKDHITEYHTIKNISDIRSCWTCDHIKFPSTKTEVQNTRKDENIKYYILGARKRALSFCWRTELFKPIRNVINLDHPKESFCNKWEINLIIHEELQRRIKIDNDNKRAKLRQIKELEKAMLEKTKAEAYLKQFDQKYNKESEVIE